MEKEGDEKTFECKQCHMKFDREASLKSHTDALHAIKKPNCYIYSCSTCDYKTNIYENLKNHMWENHQEQLPTKPQTNVCFFCQKECDDSKALQEHIQNDHMPYTCEICQQEIRSLKQYRQHMGNHEKNEDKYNCKICNAKFPQQLLLFKHIRENHPKPHICEYCGAEFKRKENLEQHMKIHQASKKDRKAFLCPVDGCNSSFTRQSNLTTHLRSIHGGVQPYTCEICGKGFLYPSLLASHAHIHEEKTEPEIIILDTSIFNEE